MYDGGRLEKLYIDNENYSNYLSLPAAERLRAVSRDTFIIDNNDLRDVLGKIITD